MKLRALLVGDNCIHARDGKYSVIGIYRKIFATQFPVIHPKMCLYACFEVERDDPGRGHVIRVELAQPEGQILFAIDGDFEIKPAYQVSAEPEIEIAWDVPAVTFPVMGPYTLRVIIDGILAPERVIELIHLRPSLE